MADKYCRLVSFLVNICPKPLRELFTEQAKADQGTAYTTLASYLGFKRPQIEQLIKKNKLTEDQIDLLFPNPGSDPAEVSQWDISLLSLLITEFFGKTHKHNKIRYFISEIRDVRNSLQHTSNTRSMSDPDFNDTWQRLETATLFLANLHGTAYECRIKKEIEDAKFKNMPDLGNTLCLWFEEKITQIQNSVEEISTNTKDIQANAREGAAILRSATVKKQGPSGEKVKRLKTVDKKLKTMQDNFERTMNSDIPDNFDAPPEVDRIKTKLRDNRLVIVAGHINSHYVAAALSAIKDISYNTKRCAELQRSSDWSHIDPEDVDFVLCCHPFGNGVYDEEKSKGMADIFNSIQDTVKEEGDDNKLAVLIVTDIGVLGECKERHYHDILEEVVTVYHSTSETQPADLTVAKCVTNSASTSAVTKNLTELTGLFLNHYKRQVHPDILKTAKTKIKVHKAVVLVGPPGSGKTSLTVALADSYHPSQVLLLTYPEQVQHIDLLRINLVVIEDFVGKYDYNKANICNWYKTFDLLHVLKSAGKLNIVITCDKQKLEKCFEEIATHPLLEHTVELLSQSVLVKQEISNSKVPTQSQHIAQQPPQSHAAPAIISVSGHAEHHSKSSSFPQPRPANAHTKVAQTQTAQVYSNQSPLPAHRQAANSLFMNRTPQLLSTPNTPYTESRGSESPLNLCVPRYTSVISRKQCFSLINIVSDNDIYCTSMCLTKDMSIYVAVETGYHKIFDSYYYLLYHDKNTNNTFKYSVKSQIEKMCCTNIGDIIVVKNDLVTDVSTIRVLRITDGSAVVIRTTQVNGRCRAVSCDDEDQIYTVWSDGVIRIYNTSLVSIGQHKLSNVYAVGECIVSPKGHFLSHNNLRFHYENFKSDSDFEREYNYYSRDIVLCAASEDPFTVFVKDFMFQRILHLDSHFRTISEIPFTFSKFSDKTRMVFDKTSLRLIVYESDISKTIHEIYIK